MFTRCRPYLILAFLWLAYFHPLVLAPGGVLWGDFSDFEAEHLPAKLFLNREWRTTGELPLWNPHHFCGTPFVHDIQVGMFYPPYAVTYLLPESAVGAALSWVIALHTLLAGVATFLYVRSRGVGEVGGLLAGVGVMLSAKWMTHLLLAGHTITVGLAWLPLVLLGLETAIRRGGVRPILGTGVAVALLVLGTHPQWAFYSVVFAAFWTLGTAMETANGRSARALIRWVGIGLAVGVVAFLLTAVQLLPTAEASAQSARTGELAEAWTGKLVLGLLARLVGPEPVYLPPTIWESRLLVGAFWLALGVLAAPLTGGRRWWEFAVVLGLLAFTLVGGFVTHLLPGFQVFRNPSRMSLILVFPVAILAGDAADQLLKRRWDDLSRKLVRWLAPAVVLLVIAPAISCFGLVELGKGHPKPLWPPFVAYWIAVGVGFPLLILAGWLPGERVSLRVGILALVLLAETVVPVSRAVTVRPAEQVFPASPLIDELASRGRPATGRVADWYVVTPVREYANSPQGMGAATSLVRGYDTTQGYNPLDVRHYREYLHYAGGGEGRLVSLHPLTLPILPNVAPRRKSLIDHLNLVALAVPVGYDPKQFNPAGWKAVARFPGPAPLPLISPDCPRPLPAYTLFENPTALPRAWVVPTAERMPDAREAAALTACDFQQTVLLSGEMPIPTRLAGPLADVRIADYQANRVTLESDGGTGWLVLADVWFPGWVCRIDGVEVPIRRANHAFRAVELPANGKRIEFAFEPKSYRVGWWVSAISVAVVALLWVAVSLTAGRRRGLGR